MTNIKNTIKKSFVLEGKEVTIEQGRIAHLTTGSAIVSMGDTSVLATVVVESQAIEMDFLPLTVNYVERFYSAGMIGGSPYRRREARPTDEAILDQRIIDRSIRPMFPAGWRYQTQITITTLSYDKENDPMICGSLAASVAIQSTGIPWEGPIATARVGMIDGNFILNPTKEEIDKSDLDLVVSCTEKAVVMVEAGAKEISESKMLDAIFFAHEKLQTAIQTIKLYEPKQTISFYDVEKNQELYKWVSDNYESHISQALDIEGKKERNRKLAELKDNMKEKASLELPRIHIKPDYNIIFTKDNLNNKAIEHIQKYLDGNTNPKISLIKVSSSIDYSHLKDLSTNIKEIELNNSNPEDFLSTLNNTDILVLAEKDPLILFNFLKENPKIKDILLSYVIQKKLTITIGNNSSVLCSNIKSLSLDEYNLNEDRSFYSSLDLFNIEHIYNYQESNKYSEYSKETDASVLVSENNSSIIISSGKITLTGNTYLFHKGVKFIANIVNDHHKLGDLWKECISNTLRKRIFNTNTRIAGRDVNKIRKLSTEVAILPRVHGSAIFERGETMTMCVATIGSPSDTQTIETLDGSSEKRYMHHYNFPGYSVGEIQRRMFTGNREIGHGALAERALVPVLPDKISFPYTIRVVNDIMSCNGSSSMASVCGSSLALMDAGVPIKSPVAGIAMGLVEDGEKYVVLTDIQGEEDHLGDMDFKVAGTSNGITAMQMDIKISGLKKEIFTEAFEKARLARLEILENMNQAIPSPRPDLSPYAPRIISIEVKSEMIGKIIGKGGETIQKIIAENKVEDINIEETEDGKGIVYITSLDKEASEKALQEIKNIIWEPTIGNIIEGKITRIEDYGLFINLGAPGKDGMAHVSQLGSKERLPSAGDLKMPNGEKVKLGDILKVKIEEIDQSGKVKLKRII